MLPVRNNASLLRNGSTDAMKIRLFCILCLIFAVGIGFDALAAQSSGTPKSNIQPEEPWVIMPAGGKPAFMGIHGGTMPVSLLVYGDGTSLVTFVGRTGNDFLDVLRRTDLPVPSLLNATAHNGTAETMLPAGKYGLLTAGNTNSTMPVFNVTGERLSHMDMAPGQLQPFGLSDKPLSIEGEVSRPTHLSPAKQYRLFFQPQYLHPRRPVR